MFNNKFNPDVVHTFENEDKSREDTKYELKNIPYKVIIKSNNKIINQDDIKKDIKENKDEVKKRFDKMLFEKKIKLMKDKKKDIKKNLNSLSLDSNYINDFSELRDGFKSEYKDKEDDIVKDRENYNNMIESLINNDLLG